MLRRLRALIFRARRRFDRDDVRGEALQYGNADGEIRDGAMLQRWRYALIRYVDDDSASGLLPLCC